MKNFLRKVYYKYFVGYSIKTVHVRGRLSQEEEELFKNSKGNSLVESIGVEADKKIILEIGFGNGQHLVGLAIENQDSTIYGVELYKAGIVKVLKEIKSKQIGNLKIIYKDARQVVDELLQKSVQEMFILFPDPWPKKRHHKRRLLQKDFIKNCVQKLKESGVLYIATDWENYAEEIEKSLMQLQSEKVLKYSKLLNSPVTERILKTTFAKRAEKDKRLISVFRIM